MPEQRRKEGSRMTAKDVLKHLLARKWSIINYHEEVEAKNFGASGWLINDVTGQKLKFEFYSDGDYSVLKWIDPAEAKI
jgi:hypothetical protein